MLELTDNCTADRHVRLNWMMFGEVNKKFSIKVRQNRLRVIQNIKLADKDLRELTCTQTNTVFWDC